MARWGKTTKLASAGGTQRTGGSPSREKGPVKDLVGPGAEVLRGSNSRVDQGYGGHGEVSYVAVTSGAVDSMCGLQVFRQAEL